MTKDHGLECLPYANICDISFASYICTLVHVCSFLQDDPEDLSFKKGDILEVLRKDEEEWWFARHEDGREGSIPVPYVQIVSVYLKLVHT